MINVGDEFVLHSKNGMDYKISVVNINDFREPSMKYAIDMEDGNGVQSPDVIFVGEEFFSKCERAK